jgi:hypothetical protein
LISPARFFAAESNKSGHVGFVPGFPARLFSAREIDRAHFLIPPGNYVGAAAGAAASAGLAMVRRD